MGSSLKTKIYGSRMSRIRLIERIRKNVVVLEFKGMFLTLSTLLNIART